MTMREFKKYLDRVIKEKEEQVNKIIAGKSFKRQTCKTWLMFQNYLIEELKDIRKVIDL